MEPLHCHCAEVLPEGAATVEVLRGVARGYGGDYAMLHTGAGVGDSVIGVEPLCRVMVDGDGVARVWGAEDVRERIAPLPLVAGRPLEALQACVEAVRFAQPHRMVGWLGLVSYDVGRFLEDVEGKRGRCGGRQDAGGTGDDMGWPVVWFTLFRNYLVFEGGKATAYRVGEGKGMDWDEFCLAGRESAGTSEANRGMGPTRASAPPLAEPTRASAPLAAASPLAEPTRASAPLAAASPLAEPTRASAPLAEVSREEYERKVERVKEYIGAGDIYQANLAQRWKVRTKEVPEEVFGRLCAISPAPYAACMRFTEGGGVRHVVSASPELFLEVREERAGRVAVTRPIKGTRPRDLRDAGRDAALREELVGSAKDAAELTMIVDLLRNDLGRVSEFGSVRVTEARAMEAHPTVWHTVGTVESRLRARAGLAEVLGAVCPGGSITGAPKIRAMQIIEELEGFRRGLYCGNIGVIGDGGRTMTLNIAIRTILFQEGCAYVYAGGGVVADSEAGAEYEETLDKARAMMRALGVWE